MTLDPLRPIAPWAWREAGDALVPPPPPSAADRWSSVPTDELIASLASDEEQLPDPGAALALCGGDHPAAALQHGADALRRQLAGETVTYVINRNLNFTNHCVKHCGFCAFRRDAGAEGAFWHGFALLQEKARAAQAWGATELCLQGGLNPMAREAGSALRYYEALLGALLEAAPGIHLHAFSPQELLFIAEQDDCPLDTVIQRLREAGLGSVPGTAAEVLSERVRRQLCPEKLSARAWCAVVLQVQRHGLASTATMMAGHIEAAADRVAHWFTLVALQQRAWQAGVPGFSEFVLLPFIGAAAPEPLRRRVGRDQPDRSAMLTLTAQARLLLGRWLVNHQPSWVKLGLDGATEALRWGCNDIGGTLMEEHITTMAGATGGTSRSPQELSSAALGLGRPVRQRTTLYGSVGAEALPA